jgi:hypothetical protein
MPCRLVNVLGLLKHYLRALIISKSYVQIDTAEHLTELKTLSKDKVKAVPLQAWSGLEDSRKLSFPDFVTTAQDGDKVVRLTHRPPLPPGNTPNTHFC